MMCLPHTPSLPVFFIPLRIWAFGNQSREDFSASSDFGTGTSFLSDNKHRRLYLLEYGKGRRRREKTWVIFLKYPMYDHTIHYYPAKL